MNKNKTLVVIPTIAGHASTYHAVSDVLREEDTVVLVVDNGADKKAFVPSALRTRADIGRVRVLNPKVNLNWLHSNNVGAAIAVAEGFGSVCFLNDDVRLSAGFFFELRSACHGDARLVVPRYNGFFGREHKLKADTQSQQRTRITYSDGTCMFLPIETIADVGYLDPCFRQPGWGADIDYCHRVTQAGFSIYAADHAHLNHYRQRGGKSAKIIYGSEKEWIQLGMVQLRQDLEAKYGPDWRKILPTPDDAFP